MSETRDHLDKWAEWLLHDRDGDDREQRRKALEYLLPVRDRILERAEVRPGEILLDVGTGDGLIAFAAVDRVGTSGRVIASDVSRDLLAHAETAAPRAGVADRMTFVETSAEDLSSIGDASVDVVTTRSVLDLRRGQGVGVPERSTACFVRVVARRSSSRPTATSPNRSTSSGGSTHAR